MKLSSSSSSLKSKSKYITSLSQTQPNSIINKYISITNKNNSNNNQKDNQANEHKEMIFNLTNIKPSPLLPEKSIKNRNKKTLLLDLDETILHSSEYKVTSPDMIISIDNREVYIKLRPFLKEFLTQVSVLYEIIVYTSSYDDYALEVCSRLTTSQSLSISIDYLLSREACLNYKGEHIKQVNLLGRDLSQIVVIDNNPIGFLMTTQNGIGIRPWIGNAYDNELKYLTYILLEISQYSDVRDGVSLFVDDSSLLSKEKYYKYLARRRIIGR